MTVENAALSKRAPIAVFGASGHTGRFVVAELVRRGLTPRLVARDGAKLAESFPHSAFEVRVAGVDDANALDHALAGAAAVINCAGPFLDTAEPIVAAAARAGVHYLDVTAEQASARAAFERFSGVARERGIVVVPAMGFYGGLGDLLATAAMGDWDSADEITIAIALSSWQPTQGTRLTGKRNTVARVVLAGGELVLLGDSDPEARWKFPEPFGEQNVVELPFTETIAIAHHLRVRDVHTYLNTAPLRDLSDPRTPAPTATDERRRSDQTFLVDVIARNGTSIRRAIARGRDIYAFTAPLVVEAAQRVLAEPVPQGGVYAPGELFDAVDFLRALEPEDLSLEIAAPEKEPTVR
jgi:short subunit dehydrogenase-like uncharacterized protein